MLFLARGCLKRRKVVVVDALIEEFRSGDGPIVDVVVGCNRIRCGVIRAVEQNSRDRCFHDIVFEDIICGVIRNGECVTPTQQRVMEDGVINNGDVLAAPSG